MRKWLAALRPNPWLARRLMVLVSIVGVGVGAFCWGRHGALPQADAQSIPGPTLTPVAATPGASQSDYARRVVAYIYNDIPVTREELGEYLIARFGGERVEFLVNRKIVEMACRAKNVDVSDAEVEAQLTEDIHSFGPTMTREMFVQQVLKRFNKSLYEWKEDVVRPRLAMTKLVRPTITVTPDDVQREFEARYGPKVKCRMIVLQKDNPHRTKIWEQVRQSEENFLAEASKQFIPELASRKGEIPPIHRHFPDPKIEKEAFSLKPGDISSLIEVPDGTWVILRCVEHLPPDQTKRIEDVRMGLSKEIFERKLQMRIPEYFGEMRRAANPRVLIATNLPPNLAPPPAVSGAPAQKVPPPVN